MTTSLEKLLQQEKKLKARIAAVKARERTKKRKDETRLKILVGSMVITEHLKAGTLAELRAQLEKYLKRDFDRRVLYILDEMIADAKIEE
jgi:molybdopterin-guanine dinucleotide biosynthesis protein